MILRDESAIALRDYLILMYNLYGVCQVYVRVKCSTDKQALLLL